MKKLFSALLLLILFFTVKTTVFAMTDAEYQAVTEKIHYLAPTGLTLNRQNQWVSMGTFIATGSANPQVKMYLIGDLREDYTKVFYQKLFANIYAKHQQAVQFIYQYNTIFDTNPEHLATATIAQCAGEQQQFWPNLTAIINHDLNSTNYQDLENLDQDKFKSCLTDLNIKSFIQSQVTNAQYYGLKGTPIALIVNTQKPDGLAIKLSGAQDATYFDRAIKESLGDTPEQEQIQALQNQVATQSAALDQAQQKISLLEQIIQALKHFFHLN